MSFLGRILGYEKSYAELEKELAETKGALRTTIREIIEQLDSIDKRAKERRLATYDASSQPSPWEILNIPVCSSETEIKRAYRKEAVKWHTDKAERFATDLPHVKELMNERFNEITAAYKQLTGG